MSQVSARGFLNVATTQQYWRVWATPQFYSEHMESFNQPTLTYLDLVIRQVTSDFGYSVFPIPEGGSYDQVRLDLVLDPAAQGGAHTGTAFGGYGVSVSPDAIYNPFEGVQQFWWSILTLHETVNVFTGSLARAWVWADGSPLWAGTSPFPNMCDVVVTKELGHGDVSKHQASRVMQDAGVKLFMDLQNEYGWRVYRELFQITRARGIADWSVHPEPRRSAIVVSILSSVSGEDLLPRFNTALRSVSGHQIPIPTYRDVQQELNLPGPAR